MKKPAKKLALNKETLRSLSDNEMGIAAGGALTGNSGTLCGNNCGRSWFLPCIKPPKVQW